MLSFSVLRFQGRGFEVSRFEIVRFQGLWRFQSSEVSRFSGPKTLELRFRGYFEGFQEF
jgi:hypothetical protein